MGLLTKSKQKALSNRLSYTIVGNNWLTPSDNSTTYIDNGYKTLPNLYGIISLITQKSSIVPMQVMRVKNKSKAQKYKAMVKAMNKNTSFTKLMKVKEEAFELVETSPLQDLLTTPNKSQSIEELYEAFDGYYLLTGNGYLYGDTPGVGRNATKPKELFVLPSPCVDPIANEQLEISKYNVSYFQEYIDADFIGFARNFNPINGTELPVNQLRGMSPLLSCRNLLKRYTSADIAQGSMFTNMGPAGVLTGDNGTDLTEEQAKAVQDRFKQFHTGTIKAGDIIVTPAKLNWQQIGLSPVDLNTIEGKKEILNELCNVYHVPIGIFTENNSTDNNMDNSRKMLITDAVVPMVEKRKQMLNKWLAPKFGDDLFIEPDYSIFPEMQDDIKALAETANLMWWISGEEKREMTGYDNDGDELMKKKYVQSSLVPLEEYEPQDVDTELLEENNATDA